MPGEDTGLEQGRQEPQALHSSPAVPLAHRGSKAGRPVRKGWALLQGQKGQVVLFQHTCDFRLLLVLTLPTCRAL